MIREFEKYLSRSIREGLKEPQVCVSKKAPETSESSDSRLCHSIEYRDRHVTMRLATISSGESNHGRDPALRRGRHTAGSGRAVSANGNRGGRAHPFCSLASACLTPARESSSTISDCDESITIIEGEAVCEIAGEYFDLKPYDVVFVPKGQHHRFLNRGPGKMRFVWAYPQPVVDRVYVE